MVEFSNDRATIWTCLAALVLSFCLSARPQAVSLLGHDLPAS